MTGKAAATRVQEKSLAAITFLRVCLAYNGYFDSLKWQLCLDQKPPWTFLCAFYIQYVQHKSIFCFAIIQRDVLNLSLFTDFRDTNTMNKETLHIWYSCNNLLFYLDGPTVESACVLFFNLMSHLIWSHDKILSRFYLQQVDLLCGGQKSRLWVYNVWNYLISSALLLPLVVLI